MKKIRFPLFVLLLLMMTACGPEMPTGRSVMAETAVSTPKPITAEPDSGGISARARSMMSVSIPDEYARMRSPIPADAASIARGEATYTTHCLTCHGPGGKGDGPGGAMLDPAPADIARTSQILNDGYLFWRITEGGLGDPFNSGMIPWEGILSENERWDVLNYVRALGSGQVQAAAEATDEELAQQQSAMLETAVSDNLISEEEAAVFANARATVEAAMSKRRDGGCSSSTADVMPELLAELAAAGELTQLDADIFLEVYNTLDAAGVLQ